MSQTADGTHSIESRRCIIGTHLATMRTGPGVLGLLAKLIILPSHGTVQALNDMQHWQPRAAALGSGFDIALISNLVNNLPSGLISAAAVKASHAPRLLRAAVPIGVDLGPNLSVTGSLATILWLIAIRRDGLNVTFWDFLKWGCARHAPRFAFRGTRAGPFLNGSAFAQPLASSLNDVEFF